MKVIDIIHDCKDSGITSYSGIDVNLLFSSEFLNLSIDDCIRIICNEGHLLLLIFLIFAGAKIKCIIKDGILIYNCNNYIAILLINNCINIDAKDIYGRTTLSWLCTQDNNDTTDYMGCSPLSYACQYNNKYATEILIKNKANVDMIDNSGNSLLYYSYLRESNDIFRLLLENNANPNILNNDNKILLDIMIDMYGFYEITIMKIQQ